MFSIGEFARYGRVSVRMLRHYDAIELLRPARVDPGSGYRFYDAAQLTQLNRIIALKDLGFTLQQAQTMLDEQVSAAELRGMLRLRRAELQDRIEDEAARLARVEARLRTIESEGRMPVDDVVIKPVSPIQVAELSATAPGLGPNAVGPVIEPLFDELIDRLKRAGLGVEGPAIVYYEDSPDDDGSIVVHAAMPVDADPRDERLALVELPGIERAATIVHRGPIADVMSTAQTLARWVDANGYRSAGYLREVYLEAPDDDRERWVTELQEPLA